MWHKVLIRKHSYLAIKIIMNNILESNPSHLQLTCEFDEGNHVIYGLGEMIDIGPNLLSWYKWLKIIKANHLMKKPSHEEHGHNLRKEKP